QPGRRRTLPGHAPAPRLARRQGEPTVAERRPGHHHRRARRGRAFMKRYVVGVDLGTTNSALAYVDTQAGDRPPIEAFPIPQLLAAGEVAPRPTLPSYLYLPAPADAAPQLALPWDAHPSAVAGEYARSRGAEVPNRLVSSAKSWLCHPIADRTAPI